MIDFDQRVNKATFKLKNTISSMEGFKREFTTINKPGQFKSFKEVCIYPPIEEDSIDSPVILVPLSDLHLGSKQCNTELIGQMIDLIMNTPNCYTVLLGDQSETATKQSIGLSVYDEAFDLKEQMRALYKMFLPLAREGKILGMLTGNHEMRVAYSTSLNPTELLAERLNVPYFAYSAYILLRVGDQAYKIFAHHGVGGGSTPSGKLNAMRKLNTVADADLYLSGHTHGKMYDNDIIMSINSETGIVEPRVRHYAVCGSFLEYWGGYAEMKCLPPADIGSLAFEFNPERKSIEVIK